MTEIHNYLQVTQEELPCYCQVSNVSDAYTKEYGEVRLVVDIITEPLFKDTYPHTDAYAKGIDENKQSYIQRALTDNNRLYDFAIKE